jgi:hypothetical protein
VSVNLRLHVSGNSSVANGSIHRRTSIKKRRAQRHTTLVLFLASLDAVFAYLLPG